MKHKPYKDQFTPWVPGAVVISEEELIGMAMTTNSMNVDAVEIDCIYIETMLHILSTGGNVK